MRVIYKHKKLKTMGGKWFSFPKNVYYHIKETVNREKQKFDNIIVVTGAVGGGKSNLAMGICGVHEEEFYKREYNLENVNFLIDGVLEKFDKDDNSTHAINYDEAVQGGTGKDGMTKIGQKLRKSLITKRFKRHLLTLSIDNPKELNDKIIERCVAWYHVFAIRNNEGKYMRGYFKVFSPKDLFIVYEDLKSYRYRFVEQHPLYRKNKNSFKSYDYSGLWYDETDYEKKKSKDTAQMKGKEDNPDQRWQAWVRELGVSTKEIAKFRGVAQRTVQQQLKDMSERNET